MDLILTSFPFCFLRWLQPDSYADPQKTSLILNKDDIRCGWPTTVVVQTKDQYGDVVHVPNMKVSIFIESNAVLWNRHLTVSALCCRLKSKLFLSLRRSPSSRRTWRNCSVCQALPLILHQALISHLVVIQHPNWRRHTSPWSSKRPVISPSLWWRFLSYLNLHKMLTLVFVLF